MILLPVVLPIGLVVGGAYLIGWGDHPVWGVLFVLIGLLAGYVCYPILFGPNTTRPRDTARHFKPSECPQRGKHPDTYSPYNVKSRVTEWTYAGSLWPVATEIEYRGKCTLCGLNQIVDGPKAQHP